jgi:K(+)-stimulated pyrophosphate-energized sodium pump
MFAAYQQIVGLTSIDLLNPTVLVGLLLGSMLPFLFSSFAMDAVGRAAMSMIEEVRRQFREIPGLMEGKAEADFRRCVDIATAAAIKEMIVPGLIAVLTPVAVGFLGSPEMLGGLLAGVTATGVLLALFQSNAGGAWDNAKKHIEGGAFGGKGSDAHTAAVIGDTVGDPFKDTSGPSLNILIKLMAVISVVIAPLLIK